MEPPRLLRTRRGLNKNVTEKRRRQDYPTFITIRDLVGVIRLKYGLHPPQAPQVTDLAGRVPLSARGGLGLFIILFKQGF